MRPGRRSSVAGYSPILRVPPVGPDSLAVMLRPSKWMILGVAVVVGGVLFTDLGVFPLIVAVLASALIFKAGFATLGGMSQLIPEPPPAGELRKVKIQFRCSICGSEARMTVANDEMPEPPRHCLEDMDLVAPTMD